jgi:hypothetical protein
MNGWTLFDTIYCICIIVNYTYNYTYLIYKIFWTKVIILLVGHGTK